MNFFAGVHVVSSFAVAYFNVYSAFLAQAMLVPNSQTDVVFLSRQLVLHVEYDASF